MGRRGWVLFGAMCVLWGIPYLLIKVAVAEVSVPVLVLARCAVGAAVLLPLALRHGAVALLRAHWRPLLAFAAVEIIGPWALLSDAERRLDSSLTGLLVAAVPIVAVLAERVSGGRERLGPLRVAGLALGLGGVALLAAPHLGGGTAWAIGEVLLVAVGYATGPVVAARRLTAVPGLLTTAACLTLASLVYLPFAVAAWPAELPAPEVLAALAAPRAAVHGDGLRAVLRADQGDRPGQGRRDHLCQPGGRGRGRRAGPRRAADRPDGRRLRPRARRFPAGHDPSEGDGARTSVSREAPAAATAAERPATAGMPGSTG